MCVWVCEFNVLMCCCTHEVVPRIVTSASSVSTTGLCAAWEPNIKSKETIVHESTIDATPGTTLTHSLTQTPTHLYGRVVLKGVPHRLDLLASGAEGVVEPFA